MIVASATVFTSKERDAETGLDYFLARYYSGLSGRFTSTDEWAGGMVDPFTGGQVGQPGPLPYADIGDPQTINKYAYVRNNPLRYTDPDGHKIVLCGSKEDQEELRKRILANASRVGEATLFRQTTDRSGRTQLILDRQAVSRFRGKHSEGYRLLVETIQANDVTPFSAH